MKTRWCYLCSRELTRDWTYEYIDAKRLVCSECFSAYENMATLKWWLAYEEKTMKSICVTYRLDFTDGTDLDSAVKDCSLNMRHPNLINVEVLDHWDWDWETDDVQLNLFSRKRQ